MSKLKIISSILFSLIGCRTSGVLDAKTPATVFTLNPELKMTAHLGRLPLPIEGDAPIERYAIQAGGGPTEYLMIVSPKKVDGNLTFPFSQKSSTSDSALLYHSYLDQLLRSHRMLLRGELTQALVALNELDERYQPSFGSLILRGNIHYIQGNGDEAQKYFQLARRIYPDAKSLEALQK